MHDAPRWLLFFDPSPLLPRFFLSFCDNGELFLFFLTPQTLIKKINLGTFAVVGLTEEVCGIHCPFLEHQNSLLPFLIRPPKFEKSLFLLEHVLGIPSQNYKKKNVLKTQRHIPSQDELNIITKRNALDIELYEYAKLLFRQQASQLSAL